MKVDVKIYKQNGTALHFVDSGTCEAYVPIIADKMEPYVALNFGEVHLHVSVKDFKRMYADLLYNTKEGKNGTALLRPNF